MPSNTDAGPALPTHCPFCASTAISASGQKVTAATYWRCESCSQLWHPERLRERAGGSSSIQSYREPDPFSRSRF